MAEEIKTDSKVKKAGDSHSFRNVMATVFKAVFPLAVVFGSGYLVYTMKRARAGLNVTSSELVGSFGEQGGSGYLEMTEYSFSCRVGDFAVSGYPLDYEEGHFEAVSGEKTALFSVLGKNEIFSVTFGVYFVRTEAA